MLNINEMNDNILSRRWKERYASLSEEQKRKFDYLAEADISEYQLKVIKRKRAYPEVGDIFQLNPRSDIFQDKSKELFFYGIVVNNHVDWPSAYDLLVVFIFKDGVDIRRCIKEGIKKSDLLMRPVIATKLYWTRGFFYNVDHIDEPFMIDNYGFYDIGHGSFVDEYRRPMEHQPELLGSFAIMTDIGIARTISKELIIAGVL